MYVQREQLYPADARNLLGIFTELRITGILGDGNPRIDLTLRVSSLIYQLRSPHRGDNFLSLRCDHPKNVLAHGSDLNSLSFAKNPGLGRSL